MVRKRLSMGTAEDARRRRRDGRPSLARERTYEQLLSLIPSTDVVGWQVMPAPYTVQSLLLAQIGRQKLPPRVVTHRATG